MEYKIYKAEIMEIAFFVVAIFTYLFEMTNQLSLSIHLFHIE
jgi:hypothetical protein